MNEDIEDITDIEDIEDITDIKYTKGTKGALMDKVMENKVYIGIGIIIIVGIIAFVVFGGATSTTAGDNANIDNKKTVTSTVVGDNSNVAGSVGGDFTVGGK